MNTLKFWLVQIISVALIGLVFGGVPAFAGDDLDDQKWHDKWQDKWDKKIAKHDKKMAKHADKKNYEQWHDKMNAKMTRWQDKFDRKMAKHYAKHHADDGTGPSCSRETPDLCTTVELCEGAGGMWFNGCMFP